MRWVFLGGALAFASTTATAGEQLLTGAPPAWVKPGAEIKASPVGTEGGQALRMLRFDRQLNFSPSVDAIYQESVTQIRTGLGLQGAGTITLSWDPSRDTVTLHKLRIVRPDQTIDVLARQSFTVIRRETNFRQIVDGRLTATLQPVDLRIGDQIEFAYSVAHSDPVMQGRTDVPLNLDGLRNVEDATLRATWPASEPITWRAGSGLPAPKVTRRGGEMELALEIKNQATLEGPKGAPRRYWPTRELEFSEFKTWADVAATVATQFREASVLAPDSPLHAEAAKIRQLSPDPKVQAAAALKLVQEQVRYLALVLTDGGYTPVSADKTWERRFGECKGKSVLLVALLRELGIEAEPVLVNAFNGEGLDRTLPRMSAFNHVIVRAVIGGKVYWLDGTRTGDEEANLDRLDTPSHKWALPLRAKGAELIPLVEPPSDKPLMETVLEIDAREGVEAASPVHAELVMRGAASRLATLITANMPPADREKRLKSMLSQYSWIEVKTVQVTRDAADGASRIVMEGTAKPRWVGNGLGQRWLNWPSAILGQRGADYKRDPGPGADAPFAVTFPMYVVNRFSIRLPNGGAGFAAPAPDVNKTVAGRTWVRRTTTEGDRIVIESSVKAVAAEFPASEAAEAQAELARMAAVNVFVRAPIGYRPTEGDVTAWLAETPATVPELLDRGSRLMRAPRLKEAIADFDKAIALDPASATALANRGMAQIQSGDVARAKQDLEAANKLDPRNGAVQSALGTLALREGRLQEAVVALTRAAELIPANAFAITNRADAYRRLGETDKALADLDTLLQIDPKLYQAKVSRAEIYAGVGDNAKALTEIDAALAAAPRDERVLVVRAGLLARLDRRADAEAAFTAALAVKPTAEAYLTRAVYRPKTDLVGRLADIDAAEKLSPEFPAILPMRVSSYLGAGKATEALALVNQALRKTPQSKTALGLRINVYARAGQPAAALKDLDDLRKLSVGPMELNNVCWIAATQDLGLENALRDCDAALALQPGEPAFIDSKALVLLRLGRRQEALAAYDEAVRKRPQQAASIYGRGLTKARLGMAADAEADLASARKINRQIDEEFAGYGLKP